ncbi:hypothetical protein F2Q70_00038580 [Brassica cretica]|uniref:Uncharacterized protein n=1 Tax=Brassica cretica TaxID=69181 RepID=A0A8S9KEA9_BRACR|nr:hypothetical protein F2Q70_00038580 [Brassica cretica]
MDGFTKRVLRIPVEKPFDEVYYTHRLWMFFRETKETEEDIRKMFHYVRERMKLRITLKKKSDPGKFAIPCVVKGIEFPHALCDTGASVNLVELENDLGCIAACHCGSEYKTEYSKSIDTHTASSIDSNESPTTDEHYHTSLDGSWAGSGFDESFSVETVILSSNEDPTKEYDENYWKERAIEIGMHDDRYSTHSFSNTPPPSIDSNYSASVDTHPHPVKRSYASIDTTPGTSIDIKDAAFEKEKGNIPIPSRDSDGHARAMDGMILQQRSIPHNNLAGPDEYPRANTTEIGSHQSCRQVGQASIDKVSSTSFDRVKGISQLRLNQDRMETRLKELSECLGSWTSVGLSSISLVQLVFSSIRSIQLTGAGGLAHSTGNSWRSAQSGERCVLVQISVDESGTVTGRATGPVAGRFDQIGLRLGKRSGQASRKDKEKEIEKEKEMAPGDRNPKVGGVAKSNRTRPRMMAVKQQPIRNKPCGSPCVASHGSGRIRGDTSCSTWLAVCLSLMQDDTTPSTCQDAWPGSMQGDTTSSTCLAAWPGRMHRYTSCLADPPRASMCHSACCDNFYCNNSCFYCHIPFQAVATTS